MQEVKLSKINLTVEKAFINGIKQIGMTIVYTFNTGDTLTVLSYDKTNKFITENDELYIIKEGNRLLALKNAINDIYFIRNKVEIDIQEYGNDLYITKDYNVEYIKENGYSLCELLLEIEEATSNRYKYLIMKK